MSDVPTHHEPGTGMSKLLRGAIWIAIGALIAAALVCVVWVLIGDQDGIIGRAFLTILLLAAFAGIAIVESNLAQRRSDWADTAVGALCHPDPAARTPLHRRRPRRCEWWSQTARR